MRTCQTCGFREWTPATFAVITDVIDETLVFFFGPSSFVCVGFLATWRPSHDEEGVCVCVWEKRDQDVRRVLSCIKRSDFWPSWYMTTCDYVREREAVLCCVVCGRIGGWLFYFFLLRFCFRLFFLFYKGKKHIEETDFFFWILIILSKKNEYFL